MDLTIVIVNWNGGRLLIQCLESIRAHAGAGSPAVIVVDNDSSDGSREAAAEAFPEYRVINSGANLGFGRANNLARPLVKTPLVLFLNPDTEIREGTLASAVGCISDRPGVGALGCRMLSPDGSVQDLDLQWPLTPWTVLLELFLVTERTRRRLHRFLPARDANLSGYVRKLYGGFMMVRREVLEAVGWFDERYFMYAEDADLSRAIVARGWKLYYCSEAAVVHVGGGATAAAPSAFSSLMMQESINKLIRKYQGPIAAILHRSVVLAGGVLRLGVLQAARLAMLWKHSEASRVRWGASCFRYRQLVLWSLGLRRAAVPVWRPQQACDRT